MGLLDWLTGKRRRGKTSEESSNKEGSSREISDRDSENIKLIIEELKSEKKRNLEQESKLREMEDRFRDIKAKLNQMKDEEIAIEGRKKERSKKTKDGRKVSPSKSSMDAPKDSKVSDDTIYKIFSSPVLENKVFETFVVDDSNRFPYLASEAVATNEGRKYNPLFIFGPVGVGKTHLLHAIANRMKENQPERKILYSSTEKFTEVLIGSLKKDDISSFRKMYRDVDVILIDDIQMLSGREATQKEFFHMFNHLYNSGKQIVLCSDRPPSDIHELESRLRSRFEGGLIIDIQVPTFEGRRQILLNLSQKEGFSLSTEVLDYLSLYLDSSIRELEGGFNRVTAYASLMKEPITISLIRKVLDGSIQRKELATKEKEIEVEETLLHSIEQEDVFEDDVSFKDLDLAKETDMIEKELLFELKNSSGKED